MTPNIILLCVMCFVGITESSVLEFVDPYIGTDAWDPSITNKGDFGNTIPQVGVPNAHSPWSPQTVATEKKCYSPYYYSGTLFRLIKFCFHSNNVFKMLISRESERHTS